MKRGFALALALAVLVAASAAELEWPLFAGKVSGELSPLGESGPRLRWQLEAERPGESSRRFFWRIEGEAGLAHGELVANLTTGEYAWRIEEGVIPVSAWITAVADRFGGLPAGMEAAGILRVAGEGILVDGTPKGTVRLQWSEGVLRHGPDNWELSGIAAGGTFDLAGVGDLTVTIDALRYGAVTLQSGQLGVRVGEGLVAEISGLQVRGLGGDISVAPFSVPLAKPAAAVSVRLTDLALTELVNLLPSSLSEARGRVNGEFEAQWTAADGLQLGAGWVGLSEGANATLRLVPLPGLITGQLPNNNPAYAPLQRVELGETALNVSLLRAVFTPQGDADGRTATVRLQAEPVDPQLKAPLIIDINVAGPLDQLIKMGMDGRISF